MSGWALLRLTPFGAVVSGAPFWAGAAHVVFCRFVFEQAFAPTPQSGDQSHGFLLLRFFVQSYFVVTPYAT